MRKSLKIFLGLWVAVTLLVWATVNRIEPGEMGLVWSPLSGTVAVQDQPGYYLTSPLTMVSVIDIRPQRLCLGSAAHSAPNCILARFLPSEYRSFIATEGWRYYWLANRLSFNSGYETYRGWRDVMRGYAFAQHRYAFIEVLDD